MCIYPLFLCKVLSFLRSNCRVKTDDGVTSDCYPLSVAQLKRHMESVGRTLPKRFTTSLRSIFRGHCKSRVLQIFLKPGAAVKFVQLGLRGRNSPNNVYVRAELIQKAAFSEETVTILDLG